MTREGRMTRFTSSTYQTNSQGCENTPLFALIIRVKPQGEVVIQTFDNQDGSIKVFENLYKHRT